jgi:hypothetical protein
MPTYDGGEFPGSREIFRPEGPARPIRPGFPRSNKDLRGGGVQFPCTGTGIFSSASREFPGVSRETWETPVPAAAGSRLFLKPSIGQDCGDFRVVAAVREF